MIRMEKILQFLKKAAIPALYIALAAALDQLVKNWAEANLPGSPVTVVAKTVTEEDEEETETADDIT